MVYSGATAPQAAGVIHTDFEKGFIKAEVAGFEVSRHSSRQHTRCALPIVCGRFLSLLTAELRFVAGLQGSDDKAERGGGEGGREAPAGGQDLRHGRRRHLPLPLQSVKLALLSFSSRLLRKLLARGQQETASLAHHFMTVKKKTSIPTTSSSITQTTKHSSRPSRRLSFEASLQAFMHFFSVLWQRAHLAMLTTHIQRV